MDWQPIETAPKDGTSVLLWSVEIREPVIGCWSTAHATIREWWVDSWGPPGFDDPTHWMPLPEGPNVEVEAPLTARKGEK